VGEELTHTSAKNDRDRDPTGRPRNARPRDELGRPLARADGVKAGTDPPVLPPDQALLTAQQLLDSGQAFAAHEVLEGVWKQSSGAGRELWRGLAQIAVGITHAQRGNASGARALLTRGCESLAEFAGTTPSGVDVDGVREWARVAGNDLDRVSRPPRLTVAS
jgi:hypothetical protein